MRRVLLAAVVLPLLLLTQGCAAEGGGNAGGGGTAGGGAGQARPGGRYEARMAMVIERQGTGPRLCLGPVRESLPPQCDGMPVTGWRWEDVEGEESAQGTRWGSFRVVGVYDGRSFAVEEAGPPRPTQGELAEDFESPCQEPAGGWPVPDPGRSGQEDLGPVSDLARSQPDFAGMWLSPLGSPAVDTGTDQGEFVLNVTFTGDLERHEAELRARWGGRLCVAERPRSFAELTRIQEELAGAVGETLGLEVLTSGILEHRNAVSLGVVVLDEAVRAALDQRYGEGTVEVHATLTPVT